MTLLTGLTAAEKFSVDNIKIDDIKAMMDGFDPASLLPDIGKIVGIMAPLCRIAVLIGPLILLGFGIAYLLLAPKEANHYFGYKTYFGMGSVAAWRYTQRLAGIILSGTGLVLTVAMLAASISFGSIAPMDMLWRTVRCLLWQAGLIVAANLAVHITVAVLYNRNGSLRKNK